MRNQKLRVIILIIFSLLLVLIPFFMKRGAEFSGSDDAGSKMIEEISGQEYNAWFTPVLEKAIGGEIPGEIESLLFCVQTAIGTGIIAFVMGRLVERRKWNVAQS